MRIGTSLLLAMPVVSLIELGSHRHFQQTAPTEQDWERLESSVKSIYRSTDLVTVAPRWADPLLRQALGDRVMPIGLLARSDNDAIARVIEVSFGGASDKQFSEWRERERRTEGPFLLRVLENPRPESARMRLIDRVQPSLLQVFEGPVGDPHACVYTNGARPYAGGLGGEPTFAPQRFACPSGEPHLVAITTIDDQDFQPRRCIWAHPSAYGPMTLVFRDVWLGQKLVGHAGLPWLLSRDGAGTPIHLDARFEGATIGSAVLEDTAGWIRFEWSTQKHVDQRGDLELVVSSEQPNNRRFCFTLESR